MPKSFPLGRKIAFISYVTDYTCEQHTYIVDGVELSVCVYVYTHKQSELTYKERPFAEVDAERHDKLQKAVEHACKLLWGEGVLSVFESGEMSYTPVS
jgi:hypothetical protein